MGISNQTSLGIGLALAGMAILITSPSYTMIGSATVLLGAVLTASPDFNHPKDIMDKIDVPISWAILGVFVAILVWRYHGIDYFFEETLNWLFGIILFSTFGVSFLRLFFGDNK